MIAPGLRGHSMRLSRGCTVAGNFNLFKGPEIGDFGGLGGPGGLGDPPETWGALPHTFLKGFPGPRGRPDPQNDQFPGQNK